LSWVPGSPSLLVQPGDGADFGPAAEGVIALCNVQGWGVADEQLAGKIGAQATMFQALLDDATLEQGAFTLARLPQLVATAATGAILKRIARSTKAATHGCLLAPLTITVAHAITPFHLYRTWPYYSRSNPELQNRADWAR
jgi:hypothetical protein